MRHQIVITNNLWHEKRFIFDSSHLEFSRAWHIEHYIRELASKYNDLQVEVSISEGSEITIWQNRIHVRWSTDKIEERIDIAKRIRDDLINRWITCSMRWKFYNKTVILKNGAKNLTVKYNLEWSFIDMITKDEIRGN